MRSETNAVTAVYMSQRQGVTVKNVSQTRRRGSETFWQLNTYKVFFCRMTHKMCIASLLLKVIISNLQRPFYTHGRSICYTKTSYMWCPCRPRSLGKRRTELFTSLRTSLTHTHTSCFFLVFNNPVDSVSWWSNTKRKLSTILSLYSNIGSTRRVKGFDKKHFLIRRIWRHLVTSFSVANENKQLPKLCKTACESFIQLVSIIKKLHEFRNVGW
jgi:hypothetical protein